MNLSTKQKQTYIHRDRLAVAKKQGLREGWTGSVGLADANSCMYMRIYNIYIIHIYSSKENIYIYIYIYIIARRICLTSLHISLRMLAVSKKIKE